MNMADQYQRQTAYLCTAQQLIEGDYVRKEGWEPSYMVTEAGALSRARLAGILVSAPPAELVVDDGTANIPLRTLSAPPQDIPVGAPVLVIGRPRTQGDQAYLLVEAIHRLSSPAWVQFYKEHLDEFQRFIPAPPEPEASPEAVPPLPQETPDPGTPTPPPSKAPSLIGLIRELDPGDGAPVDEVIAKAGDGGEEKLRVLIAEGEVFELRAGRVKVLE